MSKVVLEQSHGGEDFSYDQDSTSSTDTEEYLDLADLNDFMDCNTAPIWQTDKQKVIESLIENCCDNTSFKEVCFSRGGLMNGIKMFN